MLGIDKPAAARAHIHRDSRACAAEAIVTNGFDREHLPLVIPILLSVVAGCVDSCTFLGLFGVFVAQVTGSFVIAGTQLVIHDNHVIIKVLAIPVFFGAGMLTTAVVVATDDWRYGPLPWTLALEDLLLAGFAAVGLAGQPFLDANSPMALTAVLLGLSAMGVQSALVRLLMREFGSTNVMTTNTTQLAIDVTKALLSWRKKRRMPEHPAAADDLAASIQQLLKLLPLLVAFLLGTIAGAIGYVLIGLWCALAPMLVVAGVITWSVWSGSGRAAPHADTRLS
jgi:uncharacterized membrane protein YoaK (UPF0700 family)